VYLNVVLNSCWLVHLQVCDRLKYERRKSEQVLVCECGTVFINDVHSYLQEITQ
jgi:hypothetical protein